jgi:hypothetical protein
MLQLRQFIDTCFKSILFRISRCSIVPQAGNIRVTCDLLREVNIRA